MYIATASSFLSRSEHLHDVRPLGLFLQNLGCGEDRVIQDLDGLGRFVGTNVHRDGFFVLIPIGTSSRCPPTWPVFAKSWLRRRSSNSRPRRFGPLCRNECTSRRLLRSYPDRNIFTMSAHLACFCKILAAAKIE